MLAAKLLVDTSVLVDFFYGEEKAIRMVEEHRPVFVSVVVLAELLVGARRSPRSNGSMREIEEFVEGNILLPCDEGTASHYADILIQLRARGRPIPQNDIWIAAVAKQHGLALATRDAHFAEVDTIVRVPC